MALTTNGFRTGRAGASDLADFREYIQIEQDKERRQQNLEALLKEESDLMNICYELEGESFVEWYESDKVPASGSTRYRIELIKKRIADIQSQPHPVNEAQAVERGIDDTLRVGSENRVADMLSGDPKRINKHITQDKLTLKPYSSYPRRYSPPLTAEELDNMLGGSNQA